MFRSAGRAERTRRIIWVLLTLVAGFVVAFFLLFATGYGNVAVSAAGISSGMILVSSELFAVTAEAVYLYLAGKGLFTARRSLELSLLMNVTSCVLGILILG